jgi:hypothetical protein
LFGGEINCYYTVYAERVDIDKLEVEWWGLITIQRLLLMD